MKPEFKEYSEPEFELVFAYLADEASEEQLAALKERLPGNALLADHLAAQASIEVTLERMGRREGQRKVFLEGRMRSSETRAGSPSRWKSAPRVRHAVCGPTWKFWGAIAACLAVIAGALVYNQWRSTQFAEVLVAHIKATAPNVRIIRRGETIIAVVDMGIFIGDRIQTGPRQKAAFTYEGEQTEVLIDENTMLDIGDVEKGKRLHLENGVLDATVSPQPRNKPMIVTTRQAKTKVKGTMFKLAANRTFTRVDVTEGLVGFSRISGGESVDVPAGSYAIAQEGVELAVLPIGGAPPVAADPGPSAAAPGAVKYRDGRVLYRDGFESDSGRNWGLRVWVPAASGKGQDYKLNLRSDDLGVQKRARYGETEVYRKTSRVVVLNAEELGGSVLMFFLKPSAWFPKNGGRLPVSMEFDMRCAPDTEVVCPCIMRTAAPDKILFTMAGTEPKNAGWQRIRVEYTTCEASAGAEVAEVKRYEGGVLVDRRLVVPVAEMTWLGCIVAKGTAVIDNFVVKELIRVGDGQVRE